MLQLRQKRYKMARFGFALILALILAGCAIKSQPQTSKSAHLLLKTPMVRMADFAFIKHFANYTRLHVLSAGRVVLDMRLGDEICLNGPCYKRVQFNNRFFGHPHYPKLLDDIASASPIYDGKGYSKTSDGFVQKIDMDGSKISYEVTKELVRFEDSTQNIKIQIKFQEGD